MISIRQQLTRELLGAVLLLVAGGVGGIYWLARDRLQDQFDDVIQAKAHAISTLTFQANDSIRVEFSDRFMHGFEDWKQSDFFQLWDASGRDIARSESLIAGAQLSHRVGPLDNPEQWNLTLPNGRPGRALGFTFFPRSLDAQARNSRIELHLVVASDRRKLDETLWELLGLSTALAALLAGATVWLIPRVLRRGLQPLDRLGEQVSRIDSESLATRLSIARLPVEVQPIAQRLNDLLVRLEESFERERRFSADLAHELRTPLAELRSATECALKWPEARDPDFDRDTLAIAQQMERIVAHVLALARGEQDQLTVKVEPVDLAALVASAWQPFAARAAARDLQVEFEVSAVTGLADPALLRSILTNLFENAVDYTPHGGAIQVGARRGPKEVVISVANTTDDVGPADLPKLFDRFWRKDAARTGGLHLGLGLSLARAFAGAMQWALTSGFDDHGRLAFKLTGPQGGNSAPLASERETSAVV